MKYSGLFFINNPSTNLDAALTTVSTLIQGIETSFQNIERLSPWSLSHRVFRDTIPPKDAEGKPKPFAHTFQHFLHLSSLVQNRTYICIQPPAAQGTVVSMPAKQQDAHASIIRQQMAALWTPRHIISILQGITYKGGIFTIQIGELRTTRDAPQSGATQCPGIVVCITTVVGTDDPDDTEGYTTDAALTQDEVAELDFNYAQTIIRECWTMIKEGRDLGRSDIKEAMMAPVLTTHKEREREAAARMWCEILRLRGFVLEPEVVEDELTRDIKALLENCLGQMFTHDEFQALLNEWPDAVKQNDPDARRDSKLDDNASAAASTAHLDQDQREIIEWLSNVSSDTFN